MSSRSASSRSASSRSGGRSKSASSRAKSSRSGGGRSTAQRKSAGGGGPDISAKSAAELRDVLRRNLIRPLDLVMLTRERIEEVFDDAVSRGRVTTEDAEKLVGGLLQRGRKQTNDVLGDLEQLLGRGRDEIGSRTKRGTDAARKAGKQVGQATKGARSAAARGADPALAQADRVRRAVGVGPSFPVTGYDDLTAAQIQTRLSSLTPAELRKVRDYERRNANRKTVLNAVQERLS